jgi:hypothetical protein
MHRIVPQNAFVLELFLGHLDEGVGIDLVALDDVLAGDLLASVGVDLGVLDTAAGFSIELIKRDLLGFRSCRIRRDGTGDERKAQEAFSLRAGAMVRKTASRAFGTQDERWPLVPTRRGFQPRLFLTGCALGRLDIRLCVPALGTT